MQNRVKAMQGDLNKSNAMKDRLEALCRELQKQNRFIKVSNNTNGFRVILMKRVFGTGLRNNSYVVNYLGGKCS